MNPAVAGEAFCRASGRTGAEVVGSCGWLLDQSLVEGQMRRQLEPCARRGPWSGRLSWQVSGSHGGLISHAIAMRLLAREECPAIQCTCSVTTLVHTRPAQGRPGTCSADQQLLAGATRQVLSCSYLPNMIFKNWRSSKAAFSLANRTITVFRNGMTMSSCLWSPIAATVPGGIGPWR